jgi:ectoine hydroxylase-related dioxygenase (phytanoyl-CoA dioxygenase family)
MGNAKLSDQQIDSYRRDGYLVLPGFFSSEDVARAHQAIDDVTERALAGEDYSKVLELEPESGAGERVPRRIYEPFDHHDTFRRLGSDPRLLDGLASLIGPNIEYHYSKINMKPARVGSVVEWHQDMSYYPATNDDMLAVLVYLDDANEENGCLQVLPRHHTHFFDHSRPDGEFAGMVTEDLTGGRFGKPEALSAAAGSAIFLHCIAPHSSLPNRSDRPRRTLIYGYKAADSFPIYFGEMTAASFKNIRLLRGKPARFARSGGPAPPVPSSKGSWASLYQLQDESKAGSSNPSK